ncbi:alpha/beta fold hydrolase, partial [Alistipes indistinctus]|uniref:alpha/beta fold hydrolase n=1 Tax=Alistipes indistinctus TaxID=626932 RepID=UPI0024B900E9
MSEQTIPLPADVRYFTPAGPFRLECGAAIPLRIAYHTYGTFTGDNALWVCHALTANSEVADWWPHTVEAGKFLDPARWFTVCANIVGSCYGTTGPASPDPATGKPYYDAFPPVTVRDMARANLLLADHLGIAHARAVIGSSIGGFQALEMALERPGFARKLILIATAA